MNYSLYILFLITASTTVATPGPGVLITIMKSLQHGIRGAIWTILGTASGTVVMACISATGLGILLSTSPDAYEALRIFGAGYMIYLGLRNWRAKPVSFKAAAAIIEEKSSNGERASDSDQQIRKGSFFMEGIYLQMTNPMLIMFFISLFPQFIDRKLDFAPQFIVLSLTYFLLVVVIHSCYSFIVSRFRSALSNPNRAGIIYKVGGTIFILLAINVLKDVASHYMG